MEIKTFVGRKPEYIDGILRRQIELDRYLRKRDDLKLTYEYYTRPKNVIDFLSKRYITYPYYCKSSTKNSNNNLVNHITFQFLADLGYYLESSKTMITCHDIFTYIVRNNYKRPWFLQKYLLNGLKKCRFIIAISNFTKKEIITKLNLSKEKIVVIKNGINRDLFYQIPKDILSKVKLFYPEYKKILHVGSEVPRKNFITLLKAFYLVKKRRSDIKLIRVGKPLYSNIIKGLNLEKDIVYLPKISDNKLLEMYNLSDLLVFPSLYEGWGAPGIEAAACGLPVLCSNIPVFKEIYRDFPIYVPPLDHKLFAEKILEILSNKDIQEEMTKKGFKVVRNYKWKKSSIKYLKLAKFILENA